MPEVVKTVLAWIGLVIVAVGFGGMAVIIIWEAFIRKHAIAKLRAFQKRFREDEYSS